MRIIVLIISLLFLNSLYAQNNIVYLKEDDPGFGFKKISKAQMKEDIAFWHTVMEESHVNLNHSISKDALKKMEEDFLTNIKDSISQTDALLLIGKLAASLNEGHLGLPSSSVADSLYINSLRFPFLLQKTENDSWIVDRDVSTVQKLGTNARIIAVNNIPVSDLNKQFRQYYGGLEAWRKQQINMYVRKLLFFHHIQSPFTIKAITEDGRTISFTAEGYSKQQADSINRALSSLTTTSEPYTFRMLADNIGYLNYRSMGNSSGNPFTEFLKNSFTKLKETNAKGLIIDLRENSGGNSAWGNILISYFSSKPYQLASGMKWKISSHYKEYLKGMKKSGSADDDDSFYNSMKNGEIYTYKNTKLTVPQENELMYKGPVIVLIGPNTFSSANMLADGIKSYHLATVMGEPTGETGNDFGEMYNFMLPNTHIIARASTKMFTRADGDEKNFDPVIPDITVIPSAKDIKEKKDVVMETAIQKIVNKK